MRSPGTTAPRRILCGLLLAATMLLPQWALAAVPVAAPDAYAAKENTTLTVLPPGVLANDSDPAGDALTVVLVNDVTNGVLVLNPDGSFSYTPTPGWSGIDTFTYKTNDGDLDSSEVTVTLTVDPTFVLTVNSGSDAKLTGRHVPVIAAIPAADMADTDTAKAIVSSPAPGGGTPNPRTSAVRLLPGTVFVDDDFTEASEGWGYDHMATIQAAIDGVADHGTVAVAAGIYAEALVITKSLTVIGDPTGDRPLINLPDGTDSVVTIRADDVTLSYLHILKADKASDTANINIARGGTWPTYLIEHKNTVLDNLIVESGRRGAFITGEDVTIMGCQFLDQARDALYLNAVAGTTLIVNNFFRGDPATSKKAILFENFSSGDPAVSGTITIESNVVEGKNNFVVYNQWQGDATAKVRLGILKNKVSGLGSSAIVFLAPGDFAKFDAILIQRNTITSDTTRLAVYVDYTYGGAGIPADGQIQVRGNALSVVTPWGKETDTVHKAAPVGFSGNAPPGISLAVFDVIPGSPAWFPQVPLSSVLAAFAPPVGILDDKYEMTFALAGAKVVSVVFKVTGDKQSPNPAEYLAAVWPYQVKGFRRLLAYTVTRVSKYNVNTGTWDVQALATDARLGEPTVTIEDYDDPSITSSQGGMLDRVLNSATIPKPTGDYRATFSLDSAGGYLYTWVGPSTNVEELIRLAAEPDGSFPTTRDLELVVSNITLPGTYTLTVTPVNPESQFPVARVVDQAQWTLTIDQAEIDENNGIQTPPDMDAWGLAPGSALPAAPEYVGTLAEGQLALSLTLSWNAISGSRKYYLLVADAAGIPVREYNRTPLGTTPRVQVLLGVGRYQWQVASTDNAGNRVWSPLAWFVIEGTGAVAKAAALVERYTPFVDGPIAATITAAGGGTLNLGCTVAVDDAVALTLRVYVSSTAGVVFDKWLTVPAAGPFAVSLTAADGLNLMANTRYSVSALPRNRADAINYTGAWSDPTVLPSGSLGGVFDFDAVGTMSFLTTPGRIVFDFSTSGVTAADTVESKVSLRRGTTWTTSTAQVAGAATVTLPTVVRTHDNVIVLLRVQNAGIWTGWRTFWGTVPAFPAP